MLDLSGPVTQNEVSKRRKSTCAGRHSLRTHKEVGARRAKKPRERRIPRRRDFRELNCSQKRSKEPKQHSGCRYDWPGDPNGKFGVIRKQPTTVAQTGSWRRRKIGVCRAAEAVRPKGDVCRKRAEWYSLLIWVPWNFRPENLTTAPAGSSEARTVRPDIRRLDQRDAARRLGTLYDGRRSDNAARRAKR